MKSETFTFKEGTGPDIFVYKWIPDDGVKVKAVVQIAHGMAETAARYERFAERLTSEGYLVYANDHRGHGKTVGDAEKVGDLGDDGFNIMVKEMRHLRGIINKENPGLPLFLLGHSMGSFLLQRYICLYGDQLNGAILSGSNGKEGILLHIARCIAESDAKKDRSQRSYKMSKLTFGGYNKAFRPNRTKFDWLSRDEAEVDKYIADPFCGGVFTAGFFYDLFGGLIKNQDKKELANIPVQLPIYIFSGDKDPVGRFGKGVMRLFNTYRRLGIKDLSYKLYEGGRHEMLNETNREEVMTDVIDWLNRHVS